MKYPVNFFTVKQCPYCNNLSRITNELIIQYYYDVLNNFEEWTLICEGCGYKITQDKLYDAQLFKYKKQR